VARELGCESYYSGKGDLDDILKQWVKKSEGELVATGGLEMEVDIAGISCVIACGMKYGVVEFVQNIGRVARNGR
jgi:superfamily II DNA/RNA helicase